MAEFSGSTMLVCHYGLERSRAAAKAFKEVGLEAKHFVGGTRELITMSDNEIKKSVRGCSRIWLIYDQGSPDDEYQHKEKAEEKLRQLRVSYTVVDTAQLTILLRELGADINDYLY